MADRLTPVVVSVGVGVASAAFVLLAAAAVLARSAVTGDTVDVAAKARAEGWSALAQGTAVGGALAVVLAGLAVGGAASSSLVLAVGLCLVLASVAVRPTGPAGRSGRTAPGCSVLSPRSDRPARGEPAGLAPRQAGMSLSKPV